MKKGVHSTATLDRKFFLDKRGQVRRGRPPSPRFCDGCGVEIPSARAGHVCASCWASCKVFRRYLREALGLEPIKDDGSPPRSDEERFQGFGGVAAGMAR